MAAESLTASMKRAPLLGLLLLGACSTGEIGRNLSDGLASIVAPFVPARNTVTSDSLTAQRVRGNTPEVAPILPEPGNVWPAEEAPRPTLLGGPDEAMRNIPEYRPSLIDGAPPAVSPVPTPGSPASRRRGSSTPPPDLGQPGDFPRSPTTEPPFGNPPPVVPRVAPPSALAPIPAPGGRRIGPPLGGGAVVRDGNIETWTGPDGNTTTRIVPP